MRHLPKDLDQNDLKKLDQAFGFTSSGNSEVLNAWFQLTIPAGYKQADKDLEGFLLTVGRRKFLNLYTKLYIKKIQKRPREFIKKLEIITIRFLHKLSML